ncbi:hypothetical protein D3C75_1238820 [compost metagenome]
MPRIKDGKQGQELAAVHPGLMNVLSPELVHGLRAVVLKVLIQLAQCELPLFCPVELFVCRGLFGCHAASLLRVV